MKRIPGTGGLLFFLCLATWAEAAWQPGFGRPGARGYITEVFAWGDRLVFCGNLRPDPDSDVVTAAMAWDGSEWQDLGLCGEVAYAAGVFQGRLVLGGYFPDFPEPGALSHVAILEGGSWAPLGPGLNGKVYALGSYQGRLVAAGTFTAAGEDSSNGIACWDGSRWAPLGERIHGMGDFSLFYGFFPPVISLIEFADKLYAAGTFRSAGTDTIWGSAVWDGTSWSAMDPSVRTWITDMVESNGIFYATGSFYDPLIGSFWQAAAWEGGRWSPLGDPEARFDLLESIALHEGALYIGQSTGDFGFANCFANNLFRLNGQSWEAVDCTDGFAVREIRSWEGRLLVAGGFDEIAGMVVGGIASLEAGRWTAFGQGLEFVENVWGDRRFVRIDAVAATHLGIVAGGQFTFAGGVPAVNVGIWDGHGWGSSSEGGLGSVHVVTEAGGRVFAGGDHGATGEGYLAAFNGNGWEPIDNGLSGPVRALLARGDHVIAGGAFGWAGGVRANGVAEWDGTRWTPVGQGFDEEVLALAEYRGAPVAGGRFSASGGRAAAHIARFAGGAWSPLGTGTDGPVLAAVEYRDLLVVGGDFTIAGDVPARNIGAWDGSGWVPLGDGTDAPVRGLAVTGGVLVAVGSFTQAGGVEANHVATWDGASWRALDQGANGDVYSVAALPDSGIVLGGAFTRTGNIASSGIAIWPNVLSPGLREEVVGPLELTASPNPFSGPTTFALRTRESQNIRVTILDLQGRVVARPWEGLLQVGDHRIPWDGLTQARSPVPAGFYVAHVAGDALRLSRKLVKISR